MNSKKKQLVILCGCLIFFIYSFNAHALTKKITGHFVFYSNKYLSAPYSRNFDESYWETTVRDRYRVNLYLDLDFQEIKGKPIKILSAQVKAEYEAPILRINPFEHSYIGNVYQHTGYAPADYQFFRLSDKTLNINIRRNEIIARIPNFSGYVNEFESININTEKATGSLIRPFISVCGDILRGKLPHRQIQTFISSVDIRK